VETFEQMLEDDPENPPAALAQRECITEAQFQLVVAFFHLSASRGVGMGPCPISVSDALAYANAAGFCDSLRFLAVIREADTVYLEHVLKDTKKSNGGYSKHGGRN